VISNFEGRTQITGVRKQSAQESTLTEEVRKQFRISRNEELHCLYRSPTVVSYSEMDEDKLDWACGYYGRKKKYIQNSTGETSSWKTKKQMGDNNNIGLMERL
jgi:hypothetical protein